MVNGLELTNSWKVGKPFASSANTCVLQEYHCLMFWIYVLNICAVWSKILSGKKQLTWNLNNYTVFKCLLDILSIFNIKKTVKKNLYIRQITNIQIFVCINKY